MTSFVYNAPLDKSIAKVVATEPWIVVPENDADTVYGSNEGVMYSQSYCLHDVPRSA